MKDYQENIESQRKGHGDLRKQEILKSCETNIIIYTLENVIGHIAQQNS